MYIIITLTLCLPPADRRLGVDGFAAGITPGSSKGSGGGRAAATAAASSFWNLGEKAPGMPNGRGGGRSSSARDKPWSSASVAPNCGGM